jgi:hypothetical protein
MCGGAAVHLAPQGPQREDAVDAFDGDLTPSGIVNLDGSMSEHVRDVFAALDARCWVSSPRIDPVCASDSLVHSTRGNSWEGPSGLLPGQRWFDERFKTDPYHQRDHMPPEVGFRCVHPVSSP